MSYKIPTVLLPLHGFDPENFKVLSGPYATWADAEIAHKEQYGDTPDIQTLKGADMKFYVIRRITKG